MFKEYDKSEKKDLKYHRLMITRIQHERFIHLLVTIFVGTVMTLVFLTAISTNQTALYYLAFPLLILFAAYIFHYRFLENTTQKWYKVEDELQQINK